MAGRGLFVVAFFATVFIKCNALPWETLTREAMDLEALVDAEEDTNTCFDGKGVCVDHSSPVSDAKAFCTQQGYESSPHDTTCPTNSICCVKHCANNYGFCVPSCDSGFVGEGSESNGDCPTAKCCLTHSPVLDECSRLSKEDSEQPCTISNLPSKLRAIKVALMIPPPPSFTKPEQREPRPKPTPCPVNYNSIKSATYRAYFTRAITTAEEAFLETVTVCSKVDDHNECTETKSVKVSKGECAKNLAITSQELVSRGTHFFDQNWNDEIVSKVLGSSTAHTCFKAEYMYTGNGASNLGYALFNCLMRNSFHLGATIPQALYQYREALNQELVSHSGQPAVVEGPLYRGSFCVPLQQGQKAISFSFLSTATELATNFVSSTKCVLVFKDVRGAVPNALYTSEKETLLAAGQCFEVKKVVKGVANELYLDVPHAGEITFEGIDCPDDVSTLAIL